MRNTVTLKQLIIWLFFAFYLVLPEYFSIEISQSFPLISASRLLLILFFAMILFKKHCIISMDRSFFIYVAICIIVYIYHMSTNSGEAIKAIFSIILEEVLLYVAILNILKSSSQIEKAIETMVHMSGIVSILSLAETITSLNVFKLLNTVSRENMFSDAGYIRMGMVRAEASFGHPVYLGVYLICMLPFSMYFYEKKQKKRFLCILVLNILAIICTGSRGTMIALVILLLSMLIKKRRSVLKRYFNKVILFMPFLLIAVVGITKIRTYIIGNVQAMFAIIGIGSAPSTFGRNASGMSSRISELTGLTWQTKQNALFFGFGPRGHVYGLIKYLNPYSQKWCSLNTIDIGYLGIILLNGILGAVGYAVLLIGTVRNLYKNKRYGGILEAYIFFYFAYLLSLVTSTGLHKMYILFTIMMLVYIRVKKQEEKST